jgi:hypothetical protein
VRPFFDDAYLRALYRRGRRHYRDVAAAYLGRAGVLLSKQTFDLIWIEKEVFPFLPGLFEALLGNTPYVVDFDDATFHTYDLHRSAAVRRLHGRKLVPPLRGARAVTAGNAYLADYAERAGARAVHRIPTVVDLDRYPMDISGHDTTEFRIGWIGSPSTSVLLKLVRAPIERLARAGRRRSMGRSRLTPGGCDGGRAPREHACRHHAAAARHGERSEGA